jgi:DNA-binding NarL/FixJ family response regulator
MQPQTVVHPGPRVRPRLVHAHDHGSGPGASAMQMGRILIVEDDYLISTDMETELSAAGFEIVGVATSAEEAIDAARQRKPDLVVMDIRLEGERDGVDAAVEIFNATGIRSLFASAYHNAETQRRAEAAAPLGWVAKPYTMRSLVEAVRRALQSVQGPRGAR